MYPNQQQYPRPGGGAGASNPPYPQQTPYNASGAYPQQQQQPPYGSTPQYGIGAGLTGGYQQNMSAPSGGNQGNYGGSGNPYAQGNQPQGGNPYAQGNQPQGGNTYAQGGQRMPGGPSGPGGYPPSGQQPYGSNPYSQNPSNPGSGYPPQGGAYPPQGGAYPPQGGAYPPQGGAYPPQSGGYPGQAGSGFGGPGTGQNPGSVMSNDQRSQRLNQVVQQYEINPQFAARLQALGTCEIVLLCDDSGSMNTPLQSSNQTRWDELKSLVNIIADICAVMDSNGIDVYFLNREPVLNVTNTQSMRHVFNSPPQGLTPLVPALRKILAAKRNQTFEKKLLILVATDGAPTNEHGQTDIGALEAVLRQERTAQTYVTFLACTDDLESVNYLSNWDKTMPNLDVIDDYRSEKAEIQRVRGPSFPFSFGDYIVKALLGSIDPWFDALDERA
ncbi:unnamed protein product [Adineta steineri]|uniref:VWFA domain-containing protein n=1 Tax=Adineta steineri TaxID=433720 RepID=A0A814QD90_9BILA|nr:unnamed protein product [Adineta steineri]CAF1419501.1 unnamed protein product [Adineta steineri]